MHSYFETLGKYLLFTKYLQCRDDVPTKRKVGDVRLLS